MSLNSSYLRNALMLPWELYGQAPLFFFNLFYFIILFFVFAILSVRLFFYGNNKINIRYLLEAGIIITDFTIGVLNYSHF